MKRFVFRLQVLLDQALRTEDEERRRLAQLLQEREAHLRTIARAQALHAAVLQEINRLQQAIIDVLHIQACHLRREALGNDLQQYHNELAAIDERVRQQQWVLAEASHRRQALDNVRQRQYEEYQRLVEKQELQEMEEAVLPRLAREQALALARMREGIR